MAESTHSDRENELSTLQLVSVNLGSAQQVGPTVSGIYKTPAHEPVHLGYEGLQSDVVCDTRFHGGPDQAVYVYTSDDYLWWTEQLGREILPGTFGDNLTLAGLSSLDVHVEDRFHIDSVVIEATAPRIPCATLGRRMDDSRFPVAFRCAERSGFYCRVLNPGAIRAGQAIVYEPQASDDRISIQELFNLYYEPSPSVDRLHRALSVKVAQRERERLTKLINKQS